MGGRPRKPILHGVSKLDRGVVWCHRCGNFEIVDVSHCFRSGWPLCCGETMSIDSPEERAEHDTDPLDGPAVFGPTPEQVDAEERARRRR